MSSIDKSIASILEGDIESMDYGVPEFNKLFKSLDSKTKKKLIKDFPPDKPDNKDIHITSLILKKLHHFVILIAIIILK